MATHSSVLAWKIPGTVETFGLPSMVSHRVQHDWSDLAAAAAHPYMTTTIALTRRTFVDKVISLLLNMLSRLVITFLPRSKRLLISWLQSPSAVLILEPKNKVSHCFHCFPIYFRWSDGTRCHDLSFLNVELMANFFTVLFHFHKRLFSSSSLSAIRMVSFAYLRLLIFLLTIGIMDYLWQNKTGCVSPFPFLLFVFICFTCEENFLEID